MAAKYKVAHVNLSRNYGPSERQTELLIAALAKLGISQILICRENSLMLRNLHGVPNVKAIKIHGIGDVRYMGHMQLLRKAEIVHAHEVDGFKWASLHYIFFGVPYVLTVRNKLCLEENLPMRLLYTWSSGVVSVSSPLAKSVKELYDLDSTLINDCCANLTPHKPTVEKIKELFKDRFVIGHIGPLVNRLKGQADLIDAAQILENKIPQIVVLFIGAGDDLALLKDRAAGMPNIKFLGNVKNAVDYIAAMDVFAYPSKDETALGNTPLDVMSQGIPIVATDVGALPDIIKNEKTGLVVPPNNPKALADAIFRIKSESILRNSLVSSAKKEAARHSPEVMASRYVDIYSEAIYKDVI